jgi:hypothetical protein
VEFDNLASKVPGGETVDVGNAERSLKGRSKAFVIVAAAEHIETLVRENERKDIFVRVLQEQIEDLQKLVNCNDCPVLRCL